MPAILESHKIDPVSDEIGEKARGLLLLQQYGFNVPRFYVLPYPGIQKMMHDPANFATSMQVWIADQGIASDSLWAVRSSASVEDGTEFSFAGFFKTITHVHPQTLSDAIQKVAASLQKFSTDTAEKQINKYGIIIQEMVEPDYAGVAFSHNPENTEDDTIHINVVPGTGENLVSGKVDAFLVTINGSKIEYNNPEDNYTGQLHPGDDAFITVPGETIKKSLSIILQDLLNGIRRLSALKKIPVDIEFAIKGDSIFWLQVRPVTSGRKNIIAYWDNTHAESNYPGITLPLSISVISVSMERAYGGLQQFLGYSKRLQEHNQHLLSRMSGGINGVIYYNITAWQRMVRQLPGGKKISRALTDLWGMEPVTYLEDSIQVTFLEKIRITGNLLLSFFSFKRIRTKYLAYFNQFMEENQDDQFENSSLPALVARLDKITDDATANWSAPLLNGFFTVLFYNTLRNRIQHSVIAVRYPNFVNDLLYARGDVISVRIVQEFQSLLIMIQSDPGLCRLFNEESPEKIITVLPQQYPDCNKRIMHYISEYGERSEAGELRIETTNYKENPLLFIAYLKKNSTGKISVASHPPFDYKKILREVYPYRPVKRWFLLLLTTHTIARIRDRENYRFMRTRSFGKLRKILRVIDDTLYAEKLIENKRDSLYLTFEEIKNTARSENYKQLIRERKTQYAQYAQQEPPNRYYETDKGFIPVYPAINTSVPGMIKGTGCCSGRVRGMLKVIQDSDTWDPADAGKILVSAYFEPGRLQLFAQAAGLISERGNLLSHTAILCREMGIPSIVGAKGILKLAEEGSLYEMDGSTGTIIKLHD